MERFAGSFDGHIHIRRIGFRNARDDLARRRVNGFERLAGNAVDPPVVDQHLCLPNRNVGFGLSSNSCHNCPRSFLDLRTSLRLGREVRAGVKIPFFPRRQFRGRNQPQYDPPLGHYTPIIVLFPDAGQRNFGAPGAQYPQPVGVAFQTGGKPDTCLKAAYSKRSEAVKNHWDKQPRLAEVVCNQEAQVSSRTTANMRPVRSFGGACVSPGSFHSFPSQKWANNPPNQIDKSIESEALGNMNISVKSEYALKALLDLAIQYLGAPPGTTHMAPIKIADIAKRQKIPQKFLELILAGLKQNGFVDSRRGAEGGYLLARAAVDAITVGEVLRAVESTNIGLRTGKDDPFTEVWRRVDEAVSGVLDQTTFGRIGARLARKTT